MKNSNNELTTTEVQQYQQNRHLNPKGFEKEYGIKRSTQAKMRMSSHPSKIPFAKIGKFIFYDRFLINKWIIKNQIQGA